MFAALRQTLGFLLILAATTCGYKVRATPDMVNRALDSLAAPK